MAVRSRAGLVSRNCNTFSKQCNIILIVWRDQIQMLPMIAVLVPVNLGHKRYMFLRRIHQRDILPQPSKLATVPVHQIVDSTNNPIEGKFYESQLLIVRDFDTGKTVVNKVLKLCGRKVFLRCLGYNPEHDSWISNRNAWRSAVLQCYQAMHPRLCIERILQPVGPLSWNIRFAWAIDERWLSFNYSTKIRADSLLWRGNYCAMRHNIEGRARPVECYEGDEVPGKKHRKSFVTGICCWRL